MTQVNVIVQPGPPEPPDRARGWYQAAIAALLVGIYLAWWLTYAHVHLPPQRYYQVPPGVAATKLGADFRLVSLTQSTELVDTNGERQPPPADAVWVVARMEVTRHRSDPNWNCLVVLVAENRRSWEAASLLDFSRSAERCAPDDAVMGQTYPIEADFKVPVDDANRIVGVALPQYKASPDPLLTPPR